MKSRRNYIASKPKSKIAKSKTVTAEFPESVIIRLARHGKLSGAGTKAVQSSWQKGIAVTILENGKIYRVYPDGRRKFIKSIPSSKHTYTTGKARIA